MPSWTMLPSWSPVLLNPKYWNCVLHRHADFPSAICNDGLWMTLLFGHFGNTPHLPSVAHLLFPLQIWWLLFCDFQVCPLLSALCPKLYLKVTPSILATPVISTTPAAGPPSFCPEVVIFVWISSNSVYKSQNSSIFSVNHLSHPLPFGFGNFLRT